MTAAGTTAIVQNSLGVVPVDASMRCEARMSSQAPQNHPKASSNRMCQSITNA